LFDTIGEDLGEDELEKSEHIVDIYIILRGWKNINISMCGGPKTGLDVVR
jgi:hypothetical protein